MWNKTLFSSTRVKWGVENLNMRSDANECDGVLISPIMSRLPPHRSVEFLHGHEKPSFSFTHHTKEFLL